MVETLDLEKSSLMPRTSSWCHLNMRLSQSPFTRFLQSFMWHCSSEDILCCNNFLDEHGGYYVDEEITVVDSNHSMPTNGKL